MKYIKINVSDNVAVALVDLQKAEKITVDGVEITINADIPAGHKFALTALPANSHSIKYGYPIGHAREDIDQGDW